MGMSRSPESTALSDAFHIFTFTVNALCILSPHNFMTTGSTSSYISHETTLLRCKVNPLNGYLAWIYPHAAIHKASAKINKTALNEWFLFQHITAVIAGLSELEC